MTFKPYPKQKSTITSKEYREEYLSNVQKKSKYKNVKQEYNGVMYDSKLEAKYAQELDFLIDAGEVEKWERQVKLGLSVHGTHVTNYYIDFKVYKPDGEIEYVEVKGYKTGVWMIKWQLLLAVFKTPDSPIEDYATLKIIK